MTKNGTIKGTLMGVLVTLVLGVITWGAVDRLSAESRIVKLEAAAEVCTREHKVTLRAISRLDDKIDKVLLLVR